MYCVERVCQLDCSTVLAGKGCQKAEYKLRCGCVVGGRLCDAMAVTMIDAAGVNGRCCLPIKSMVSPEVMGVVDVVTTPNSCGVNDPSKTKLSTGCLTISRSR